MTDLKSTIENLLCQNPRIVDSMEAPELAERMAKELEKSGDASVLLLQCCDRLLRVRVPRHNPLEELLRIRLLRWLDGKASTDHIPDAIVGLVRASRELERSLGVHPDRTKGMLRPERESLRKSLESFTEIEN